MLIQLSNIHNTYILTYLTVLIARYLVNEDVIEVIGEAAGKFVPQLQKQLPLLLHSC